MPRPFTDAGKGSEYLNGPNNKWEVLVQDTQRVLGDEKVLHSDVEHSLCKCSLAITIANWYLDAPNTILYITLSINGGLPRRGRTCHPAKQPACHGGFRTGGESYAAPSLGNGKSPN